MNANFKYISKKIVATLITDYYSSNDFEEIYLMLREEYSINEQSNKSKINVKK